MTEISISDIEQLIAIESHVHYAEPPPAGRAPFVIVRRRSPVVISAPHGAMTYRNSAREAWHQEDDYTAGIALLLAERCGVSAIATIWQTPDSDPNYHREARSAYKRALRALVEERKVRWVIDLHGLSNASLPRRQWVDLGTRKEKGSLPLDLLARLVALIEGRLGEGRVSHNRYPARAPNRTITAFCHGTLGLHGVQIEMKSAVRVPLRRVDASAYAEAGPYAARPVNVIGMLQAIADFCDHLARYAGKEG